MSFFTFKFMGNINYEACFLKWKKNLNIFYFLFFPYTEMRFTFHLNMQETMTQVQKDNIIKADDLVSKHANLQQQNKNSTSVCHKQIKRND